MDPSSLKNHPHSTGCSPCYSPLNIARFGGSAGKQRRCIAVYRPMPAFRPTSYPGACAERRHACCVFLRCVKQDGLRGRPALVPRNGFRGGSLFVQVGEYLFDDRRVFDAGNGLHHSAAVVTGFDVVFVYSDQTVVTGLTPVGVVQATQ